jgi:ubiquitin-conjugating enzyme E2 T
LKLKIEDQYNHLIATVPGPKDSYFESGLFNLSIELSEHYPFRAPSIKFQAPIPYHPNIDETGKICLDVLQIPPKGSYNPALTLESILISIQLLLSNPNPEDPLRADVAEEYKYNQDLFGSKATAQTKFASSKCQPKEELKGRKRKNEDILP